MKELLILFANGYPYGISEPFLEHEVPLYGEYFDKTLIVTPCGKGQLPTRTISGDGVEVLSDYTLSGNLFSVMGALPRMLTDKMFYRELKRLFTVDGFSLTKLRYVLAYALCANHMAAKAHHWLKKHPEYHRAVIYSYWMYIPAYAAVRLKQRLGNRLFAVTRAHGCDLYVERHQAGGHLPYHAQLYRSLDHIAVISRDGKAYLENRYGDLGKVSVHRLGVPDRQTQNSIANRDLLRIVTCARTIPLKRLDRLVDALSQMKDYPIHWTHIGGGVSQQALESYAEEKLPANVTAEFTGTVPNGRIYEIYAQQPFHVFVNVSETEGVPVAIMEAMSFHIPVIATAVGGTSELVTEGRNGFLLPRDYEDEALIQRLNRLRNLPENDYAAMRQNAREKYSEEYIAVDNYRRFLKEIRGKTQEIERK